MIDNIKPKDVVFEEEEFPTVPKTDVIVEKTPDFYKGKSFRWLGNWTANKLYSSDEYHVDFVRHLDKMWVCTKSHYATDSTSPEKSPDCWQLALDYRTVAIHVGKDAPDEKDYGEHWTDLIWLDTDDDGSLGLEVYSKDETDACVENALKNTDTKLLQESAARKDSDKILDDKITSTQASIEESYKEYTNNEIKTLRNEITKTINAIANNKVDKVTGKQLSTNDYTAEDKAKLDGIDLSLYYTSSKVDTKIGDLTTSFNEELDKKADAATTLAGYGIINAYTKDEVNTAVETAKKEILGITDDETINAAYDTLKEVADWITNDKSGAAAMLSDIANLKTGKAEQEEVNELRNKLDNISVDLLIHTTHAELSNLKNAGNLVPGQKYRITDYVTIINEAGKFSDEHPFDIVVTALSENTLSEEASAIAREGISFFDKYNLSAWKLNYSLDNNFAKWGLTTPRGGGYISDWGLLNKTETTTDSDGKEIHLYSANDGGAYWKDKSLYKNETKIIDDLSKIFAVVEDGHEDGGVYLCTEDACDIDNGKYLELLYYQSDGKYYLDEDYHDDYPDYPLSITSVTGEYVDKAETYVKVEVSGLEELFEGFYGGEISTTISVRYSGEYDDIHVPFDDGVPEITNVKYINKVFCTDDKSYYSCPSMCIRRYQHDVKCGKGVIYRMIDEFNNDFPYDFYNIGLINEGHEHHTFGQDRNYIKDNTVENLLSVSLPFVKNHLLVARFPTNSRNTKIYAPSGFGSINLGSLCYNTNIYIAPSGTGDSLQTCNIKMVNSNNNDIYMLGSCQFSVGAYFNNNFIQTGTVFNVGTNFKECTVCSPVLVVDSDYVLRSSFKGNGYIRTETTSGDRKGGILCYSDVTLRGAKESELLRIQHNGTTSSNVGLTGLIIRGTQFFRGEFAGKERVVTIDPSYTMDSYGPLTIAQNSKGEIVQYIEADLIKA